MFLDSLGLPEPTIKLMPDKRVYNIGDPITVDCSIEEGNTTGIQFALNIAGSTVCYPCYFLCVLIMILLQYHNDKDVHFVEKTVKVTEDMDTISCTVSNEFGWENVQMRNLIVKCRFFSVEPLLFRNDLAYLSNIFLI